MRIIIPDIAEPAFIEVGKSAINDMGHAGNCPANHLKAELEDICGYTAMTSNNPRRNFPFPVQRKTVAGDIKALEGDILQVLDGIQALLGAPVTETTAGTLMQESNLTSDMESTRNSVRREDGFFFGNMHDGENSMTFDAGDLEWLDCV
jgi:hypothetical protein